MTDDPSLREKLQALWLALQFRPVHASAIIALKLVTALLEGVGVTFLLPIIEFAQAGEEFTESGSTITGYFVQTYQLLGIPLSFETLVIGLAAVMTVRFTLSFVVSWMELSLTYQYHTWLREHCYDNLLDAQIGYVDRQNGDDITNTIITETAQSSSVITRVLDIIQTVCFMLVYGAIALLLAPQLTVIAVSVLAVVVVFTRFVIRPGYEIGDRVATANETIQGLVNAGTRGLREIKLFNMTDTVADEFQTAQRKLLDTRVTIGRNQAALQNFNQLLNAFVLFALVYIAIAQLQLAFSSLGVFLFAMFRLSPMISNLNNALYSLDSMLPHLLRSHGLIDELERNSEPAGTEPAPDPVTDVEFQNVTFEYGDDDDGVADISLSVSTGETIALAGPSGAGKSTIVALLARLYEPDRGRILVNGVPLDRLDVSEWHDRVAIVPQHPYIFNETLRYNVAIGAPDASESEIRQACEISQVSAFLDQLPNGLDSELGDNAVRLSGGQRQRVAIARALLTDADVLLLDEATSELDSPTEEAIIAGIESLGREYLTVVVGHWLSTVQDADRIYTIVDGTVVESGTHRELLDIDGHYTDLYESQLEAREV